MFNKLLKMTCNVGSRVVINGKSYSGNNIVITGDKVGGHIIIDGVKQEPTLVGDITVNVVGHVHNLETSSGDVKCTTARSVKTISGDVTVSDCIHGDVETVSGDVKANTIQSRVSTVSGNITNG